ncbi:MAB_1171c family putative transporter [Streptomyces sp. NPDC006879]|uniref:MAB_1171c family putative transporter n=1 Tax=Streptomyces sp. NPDC006879 TaxID=3364767 RepID=UPI0036B94866
MTTVVLVLLWTVALWRAPSAVRSSKQRTLWVAFAALTLAMTLRHPTVMHTIDNGTGVNNLSTLLKQYLGIMAAAAVLEFVYVIARPHQRAGFRLRMAAVGTTMTALTVLFAFVPRQTETTDFFDSSAGSATATAYLLVWLAYLATAMAVATWLFWGSSRQAGAGWLRAGLRLLGAGTAVGVMYALSRAGYLVLRLTGAVTPHSDAVTSTVTDTMKHASIGLILIGSSVPALGVAWRAARHWWYLRALRPLWHDLTGAVPEVVLGEELSRRELRMRLHRRVVEIRDAILALQPYVSVAQRDAADAAAPAARPDLAHACWIETARHAKLTGHGPDDAVQRRDFDSAGDDAALDLEAEAQWLRRIEVARASDTVRNFVHDQYQPNQRTHDGHRSAQSKARQ